MPTRIIEDQVMEIPEPMENVNTEDFPAHIRKFCAGRQFAARKLVKSLKEAEEFQMARAAGT